MKSLTRPTTVLHIMRINRIVTDTTRGLIYLTHLTTHLKVAVRETSVKPLCDLAGDTLTIPPMTTKTITTIVDNPSEWNTTGTVIALEKITETAILLISHSMSTIIDK